VLGSLVPPVYGSPSFRVLRSAVISGGLLKQRLDVRRIQGVPMMLLLLSAHTSDYPRCFAATHGDSGAVHDYPPENNRSTIATTRIAPSLIRSRRACADGRRDSAYMREIHTKRRKRMNDVER
jgi:hypothetical protein